MDFGPISYSEMRPGCFQREERLADMDLNHVERSVCFPTFSRFGGQTFVEAKDKELALACVRAYNDWMVDEWCGDSSGRLIPLCLLPYWSPALSKEEVERNTNRGVKAFAFTDLPHNLGLPSLYDTAGHWDPMLGAIDAAEGVVCIHIGSSSTGTRTSPDCPNGTGVVLTSIPTQMSMADWLLSGALARFGKLKVAFAEGQIGWMPYLLERADRTWEKDRKFADLHPAITELPSTYARHRVFGCFFEDDFGVQARDSIGIDQITFESDYPHQDSTWPHTRDVARKAMKGLPQEEVTKICRTNALSLLDLPEHRDP
jgi:predicted TIM-barrel fold metal-dependent hydrolase